ncbi:hypothetical protein N658DRAFT_469797 [Parathielavia hyrcaniae]|uniref:Uncharacterized protein n=1 Tax=Parathielavia hyrcaniae TaxID=113614 RepID=A0AAN6T217_9PEZI|nr:hypothetical protein N658DRAFT_469797 [Parathielavia hyrcaniae]
MDKSMKAPRPLPLSQAASHCPVQQPLPASLLVDLELDRREKLLRKGNLLTGCGELDDYVLLGGLERGSVVGVSAEEEELGLLIGFQTVAHLLATDSSAKAMVVTTLPASMLLPRLRKALVGQLSSRRDGLQGLQTEVQACLERISVARVFDLEGLWEVLAELEAAVPVTDRGTPADDQGTEARIEVLDSEDEGGFSPSPPETPPPVPDAKPAATKPNPQDETKQSPLPDLVLVTHTSTLLKTLFTGRDKDAAHGTTLLLSSRLHSLTRSPSHGGPLIMFLNSTTTSPSPFPTAHATTTTTDNGPATTAAPPSTTTTTDDRQAGPIEPTLRSMFNVLPPPPPPPTVTGPQHQHQHQHHHQQRPSHYTWTSSAWRNKPSFGLVFSQMLDLHLLCTRVPRTRADSAVLMASSRGVAVAGAGAGASFIWAVEVLLDEVGVYEQRGAGGRTEWGRRRCREQRWGAVEVDGEGRVVGVVL